MMQITLTEFSQHLPIYLEQVLAGQELLLMAQDKIVARLLPQADHQQIARAQLQKLQQQCQIGDVISPLAETVFHHAELITADEKLRPCGEVKTIWEA